MRIDIPFNAWSKKRLKEKKKCSTVRTKQYGDIGDTFEVDGVEYVIIGVEKVSSQLIIDCFYQMEGADSPKELVGVLGSIFRFSKIPDKLWLHIFRELRE